MELFTEVEKVLPEIDRFLTGPERAELLQCAYAKLFLYHFGLGTRIRAELLKEESSLYRLFSRCGVTQRDDMSALLIRLFYLAAKSGGAPRGRKPLP